MSVRLSSALCSYGQRIGVCLAVVCGGALCLGAQGSSELPEMFRPDQVLWEIELGLHQYTVPQIDRGRVFLGINDRNLNHPVIKASDGGLLMCLEQATGKMIWQLPIPRYMEGVKAPYHFDQWKCGVCSRPAIDGDRLYIVGPRGDILCIDREGQTNGNGGPFLNDAEYMGVPQGSNYALTAVDGDIVWQYNMLTELKVIPHDVCGTSPLVLGNHVYACTGNGHDDKHQKVANPDAPSLIVLDKRTGRLVATDGNLFGPRLLHGNWSSPKASEVGDGALILFGGGDGVFYAFRPVQESSDSSRPQALKVVWKYDCNPPEYRARDGQPILYARWNKKSHEGPSEIIADPLIHKGRVYVAIGQSPLHGPGQGMLTCLDAATGKKVWDTRKVDRTLATAAIHNGLLYIPDFTGRLHCLDAGTGDLCWSHDLEAEIWGASAFVAQDKVYVSTERRELWVFKAGRDKQLLSQGRLRSVAITPTFQDGVLYLPTQTRLTALRLGN